MADPLDKPLVLKPGPYDQAAADLLQALRADAVVIVVFGGRGGTSGSVATTDRRRFLELTGLVEALLGPPPKPE